MIVKDQLNRDIHLKSIPRRIISLVPSQTELLVDLGLTDYIVGVTKFCIHPKGLRKEKTLVGGTKQINVDKVKALNPDIILCNKEENSIDVVQSISSVAPIHISDIYNITDCLELIKMYGILFNCERAANSISRKIANEVSNFKKEISKFPRYSVAYFIWRNPWMVAASSTYINYMLSLNNFENHYADLERYPEVPLDGDNNDVSLVLLSSEPFPFKEIHKKELAGYYPNAKLLLVDGEAFSWYGTRLLQAFLYFRQLHNEIRLLLS